MARLFSIKFNSMKFNSIKGTQPQKICFAPFSLNMCLFDLITIALQPIVFSQFWGQIRNPHEILRQVGYPRYLFSFRNPNM